MHYPCIILALDITDQGKLATFCLGCWVFHTDFDPNFPPVRLYLEP